MPLLLEKIENEYDSYIYLNGTIEISGLHPSFISPTKNTGLSPLKINISYHCCPVKYMRFLPTVGMTGFSSLFWEGGVKMRQSRNLTPPSHWYNWNPCHSEWSEEKWGTSILFPPTTVISYIFYTREFVKKLNRNRRCAHFLAAEKIEQLKWYKKDLKQGLFPKRMNNDKNNGA